jgi:hypothetical protein
VRFRALDNHERVMGRFALVTLFIVSVLGCTLADAPNTPSAQPSPSADVALIQRPAVSPSYEPGPASASGTVIRVEAGSVIIRDADQEVIVELSGLRSVWKETEVEASSLEVGDHVDLNGTRSERVFQARYVWANIGRFDGVVQTLVGQRLDLVMLPFQPATHVLELELSQYLVLAPSDGASATLADLKPGMTIGGVMYRPRNGMPRATRIWWTP